MEARQLVPSNGDDGRTSRARLCQAVNLPANGVLVMPSGEVITLSSPAAYRPSCTPNTQPAIIAGAGGTGAGVEDATGIGGSHVVDLRDPFYASTFPQCYALAATTVLAYTLVIMLVITPRSFLDGGVVVLGRRGFTSGGSGSGTIGGRPWLQKVAALTVAISLTIATSNTYREAEEQYAMGYQDARKLQDVILNGTELKIIRIISDTFLWLAQAQTLIRLFPRQREKVIIKWTAFALITLDLIFDSLNSFLYAGANNSRPGNFKDAVPALSYVFQLALGVLYAAWVIYYSLMKKKYAFYHPQMKNICLVAILSLFAILVPVVFFILDIAKPEFTGWGDYVRWVGAAAASVIVWEWVERIEALEREEKRDGILGREVFDGDEMLEPSSDSNWPRRNGTEKPPAGDQDSGEGSDDGGEGGFRPRKRPITTRSRTRARREDPMTSGRKNLWPSVSSIANRYRSRPANNLNQVVIDSTSSANGTNTNMDNSHVNSRGLGSNGNRSNTQTISNKDEINNNRNSRAGGSHNQSNNRDDGANPESGSSRAATYHHGGRQAARFLQPPLWPSRPPPAATPVSRTDTASADSTVYAIRYHPLTETSTRTTTHSALPPLDSNADLKRQQQLVGASAVSRDPESGPLPEARLSQSYLAENHGPQSPTSQVQSVPSRLQQDRQAPRPETRDGPGTSLAITHAQMGVGGPATEASSHTAQSPVDVSGVGSKDGGKGVGAAKWRALAHAIPRLKTPLPDAEEGLPPTANHEGRAKQRVQLQRGAQGNRWDLRTRMEDFAATQAERIRERIRPTPETESLPVTVVPAPPRRGAALAQLLEEEESLQAQPGMHRSAAGPWRRDSGGSASSLARGDAGQSRPREGPPVP